MTTLEIWCVHGWFFEGNADLILCCQKVPSKALSKGLGGSKTKTKTTFDA